MSTSDAAAIYPKLRPNKAERYDPIRSYTPPAGIVPDHIRGSGSPLGGKAVASPTKVSNLAPDGKPMWEGWGK